jgi:hypothetical protein
LARAGFFAARVFAGRAFFFLLLEIFAIGAR